VNRPYAIACPRVKPNLYRALREVLSDPDLKRRALELGIDTRAAGAAEMDAQMRGDIDKWSKVIAHANIPKL